jgi:hypothetical protein
LTLFRFGCGYLVVSLLQSSGDLSNNQSIIPSGLIEAINQTFASVSQPSSTRRNAMSRDKLKRWSVAGIQLLFATSTMGVAALVLSKPACAETMIEEAAKGAAAGVFLGFVKGISRIRRSQAVTRPPCFWWHQFRILVAHDLKSGFLGGWHLGLLQGIWSYFFC